MTDPRITEIAAQLAQSDRAFNALKESHTAQDIAHIELKARLATAENRIAGLTSEMHSRELHHFESEQLLEDAQKKIADALALADAEEHGALRWEHPLPVPYWVGKIRAALTVQDKEAR